MKITTLLPLTKMIPVMKNRWLFIVFIITSCSLYKVLYINSLLQQTIVKEHFVSKGGFNELDSNPETNTEEEASWEDNAACPKNLVLVEDRVLSHNITHTSDRAIPRVVHFFVQSRCLPQDLVNNIQHWMALEDHSILLHDSNEIAEYLSKDRADLPFVPKAWNCAFQHETILDLARLVMLFDQGGISIDIDHIPGEGFLNGNILGPFITKDEGVQIPFVVEDGKSHSYPRFVATVPGHHAIFGSIILSVAAQYRQHVHNVTAYGDYNSVRDVIYKHTTNQYIGRDWNQTITRMRRAGVDGNIEVVGIVNTDRTTGSMLTQIHVRKEIKEMVRFGKMNDITQCVDLSNDSYTVDTNLLLDVTGEEKDETETTKSCPDEQSYVQNVFLPDSVNKGRRSIPKIIHMTSKSKCMTKNYADNAALWKFDDYSFFLHDDAAIQRLIDSNKWLEFPLINEVFECISSGAMKADLWRYLVTWTFGGVYTDMDNAPGLKFNNGSVIKEKDDAFFEVEMGGFPSQYFFASKSTSTLIFLQLLSQF